MSNFVNFDPYEGESCKRNQGPQHSDQMSFHECGIDKSLSDFKREFFKLLNNASKDADTHDSASSEYFVPDAILATDSNIHGISSGEDIDLENGQRISSIRKMSDFEFPSDFSIHDISPKNSINLSLVNSRPKSNTSEMSDFQFPSNFNIREISPDGNIDSNLKNSELRSSKNDMFDYSFPSEFQVKPTSSDGQDREEDTDTRDFVHTYDWKNMDMDIQFPNYAPESKTNVKHFTSPTRGWNRVLQKYSPSTETFYSPIKPIEANIKPNVTNDELILAQVWIVGMSEQFYYDNSITLIHKYYDIPAVSLNHALIVNSRLTNTDHIMDTLVDVVILGSGGFGDVYRVRKESTREYLAVKFLKTISSTKFQEHTSALLEYLKERNSLIKARSSPFVVQFINSVKFPGINGLFLFFEWCLCDLRKYIRLFVFDTDARNFTKSLWDGVNGGIYDLRTKPYSAVSMDFLTVAIIYIFEVFCALDFLAKCNIVHQDLKPENVMIATNFHLKIADFGLAYNTSFVTRRTQVNLVDVNKINIMESSNYKVRWGGTYTYHDMELCYGAMRDGSDMLLNLIMNNDDSIDAKLSTKKDDENPDFMSDLWACGIIATELIFSGVHIFRPENISLSMRMESEASWNFPLNVLTLTYIRRNYVRYIENGFVNYGGPHYEDLMTFLASIFKPRQERASGFVKQKEVYRYKNKVTLRHIDINKVERISVFADMGLTSNNVFLYSIPKKLNVLLSVPLDPTHKTLRHLLESIPNYSKKDFIDLKPGLESNYF